MRALIRKRGGYRKTDRRGRRSLQVYTMRALIRERDGYHGTDKSRVGVGVYGNPFCTFFIIVTPKRAKSAERC